MRSLLSISSLLLLVGLTFGAEEVRNYHKINVRDFALQNPKKWHGLHTHVEVTGFVSYVAKEADSDLHIRLCDSKGIDTMVRAHCIVAECIPQLPCDKPKVGDLITVQGISRYDAESNHCWWEVHPVEVLYQQPKGGK